MKFSLIIGTLERVKELETLLESLARQTCLPHEVFVVDQNPDVRLAELMGCYGTRLPLRWLRTKKKGLSWARNLALRQATGDVVAFPDDDCVYPPELLAGVAAQFAAAQTDGVVVGETNGRPGAAGYLNRYSLWLHGISYRIFLRREITVRVGWFDEQLGLGAGTAFASGEESDYLIRCLQQGARLYYCPTLRLDHPAVDFAVAGTAQKAYEYARGRRQVLSRHGYPFWFRLLDAVWPLLRAGAGLGLPGKACYHWNQFLGRVGAERRS